MSTTGKDWTSLDTRQSQTHTRTHVHTCTPGDPQKDRQPKEKDIRTQEVSSGRQMHRHPQAEPDLQTLGERQRQTPMRPPAGAWGVGFCRGEVTAAPELLPARGPCSGQLSVYPSLVPRVPTQPPKPVNKPSVRNSSSWVQTLLGPASHIQVMSHPTSLASMRVSPCSLAPGGSAFASCCSCYETGGSEPE